MRGGFQIEEQFVPTDQKIAIVNRLSRTGLAKIEVPSFVSPHAERALPDAETVMRSIDRVSTVEYSGLVPTSEAFSEQLHATSKYQPIHGDDLPGEVAKAGPSNRVYRKPAALTRFDPYTALKQAVSQGFLTGL